MDANAGPVMLTQLSSMAYREWYCAFNQPGITLGGHKYSPPNPQDAIPHEPSMQSSEIFARGSNGYLNLRPDTVCGPRRVGPTRI